jgi:hypothetical protein
MDMTSSLDSIGSIPRALRRVCCIYHSSKEFLCLSLTWKDKFGFFVVNLRTFARNFAKNGRTMALFPKKKLVKIGGFLLQCTALCVKINNWLTHFVRSRNAAGYISVAAQTHALGGYL